MKNQMVATFEPQVIESSPILFRDLWGTLLRRKWVVILPILLSIVVAGILCRVLPKSYRSETLILVEDPKIPEIYVQGIVEGSIRQRIFLIQQQIMNRTLLGEVVREFNLYPDLVANQGIDAAIGRVRSGLKVEMVDSAVRGQLIKGRTSLFGADAFTVSFSHENPKVAMEVTSKVSSRFIEENLKFREEVAEGTTEFLDYEVLRAQHELEKKEDEISNFKTKHLGELPQQIDANLRALDRIQTELATVHETLQRQSDRLSTVEKATTEYELTGNKNPSLVVGSLAPDPLFQRFRELKVKLILLSAEYKETYPDLILTKEELKIIEQKLEELYGPEALKQIRQESGKPFDPYLQELKRQRDELKTELTLLKQRQGLLAMQKKDYERRVEVEPTVEQQLLIHLRDYDNMKNNYRSLLEKRLNARVAGNLEKRQKGGQFHIIDPANLPSSPETPNQFAIMTIGLVLGCGIGFGLVFLLEQRNPLFLHPEEVERVLGSEVLAIIPNFSQAHGSRSWAELLPFSNGRTNMQGRVTDKSNTPIVNQPRLLGQESNTLLDLDIIVKWLPKSIAAEQYRVAATRLALASNERKSTIVAVSSAVKGEGKTTTAINLGYAFARDLGKRTLLMDCDFKCPMLHRYRKHSDQGLGDLLLTDVPLDACFYQLDDTTSCWVMPAGDFKSQSNELLKSQRLVSIFQALRERFDYILLNTPPILPLADMNVLTRHADTLLLVVRAGSTPQQVVRRSLESLSTTIPIFVILNAVGPTVLPYYMDYSYHLQKPAYFE